jgi:hypothetical protein
MLPIGGRIGAIPETLASLPRQLSRFRARFFWPRWPPPTSVKAVHDSDRHDSGQDLERSLLAGYHCTYGERGFDPTFRLGGAALPTA